MISRAQWGARPPRTTTRMGIIWGWALHWEGVKLGTYPHDACDDKLRAIQNYHMDHNGWNDIAYNFVVCPHGFIYEGRGYANRSAANGTNEANDHYLAACYLGGPGDPFTESGQAAVGDLIRGAPAYPHSKFITTTCPGDEIRAWIKLQGKVPPMFDPPFSFDGRCVASLKDPASGGVWVLTETGAVYGFEGAPYKGGANGKPYFINRKGARLELPNTVEKAAGRTYTIISNTAERYSF